MKSVAWERRERRVRYALIRDMIKYGWLTCKPVSQQRHTAPLDATTRLVAIANAATVTCETEHAQ